MKALKHSYPFDPTYGHSLDDLLAVGAPEAPADFQKFWTARYEQAVQLDPQPNDETVYFHMPTHFLGGLECPETLDDLRRMDIVLVIGEADPFRENNEILCRILGDKGIGHRLHYWAERAHQGHYWRQMGPIFV